MMLAKWSKIIIICLYFIFLNKALASSRDALNSIPQEDQEALRQLFRYLNDDHFAYTLFGDKPVSLSGDFTITPWENVLERMRCGGRFWQKWEVWEKYKHLFPIKNYLLVKEDSHFQDSQNIILINKQEFIKIVNQHLALFERVLDRKINPEQMLKDIELGKISFIDNIDNNQMLWGILLGYGKHNAAQYNKKNREYFNARALSDAPLKYSTIKLDPFGEYDYSLLMMGSIHFAADLNHPETIALEKKYKELRAKISAIYAQGNFLEITLAQLTSE